MNKKLLSDSIGSIDIKLIEWYLRKEEFLKGRSKKSSIPSYIKIIPIVAAAVCIITALSIVMPYVSGGILWWHSDVRLESISGTNAQYVEKHDTPAQTFANLSASANAVYASYKIIKRSNNVLLANDDYTDPDVQDNNEAVDDFDVVPADYSIDAIPQTVVYFGDNEYAEVTIKLDNPYEYYICDFYMNSSSQSAEILVDGEWQPLDGQTKIRWTGMTNRAATYIVRLTNGDESANISITEMRYLNKREIAVDLSRKNIATVYRINTPVKTEFVVNTPERYLFKVITGDSCVSYNVEGASVYDSGNNIYQLTNNGSYTINYTYNIPGTKLTGTGKIVSSEIELLTIHHFFGLLDLPEAGKGLYSASFSSQYDAIFNAYNTLGEYETNCRILQINFRGTGMNFHAADYNDPMESNLLGSYICDSKLKVSINGGEFFPCIYFENEANAVSRYGRIYTFANNPPRNSNVKVEVKWNGYTIYKDTLMGVDGW